MNAMDILEAASLERRAVRYGDLAPCRDAFIDTRTPGSDRKENFTIIGPGVSENPRQHVHIREPHGFNIGGARQPPGCLNSQHSHDTAEVFYVHSGRWRFMSGEDGRDGSVAIGPGDLISIPTRMFRGFENVGDDVGFLWAVLGGDDPGRVLWAPYVFDMAKEYGLVLLEDGALIDTLRGETMPPGKRPMPATTRAQVEALDRADDAAMARIVLRGDDDRPPGALNGPGYASRRLVGAAPIDWAHGFTIDELTLAAGAAVPAHAIKAPDVWFVQAGEVEVEVDGQSLVLAAGDTFTVPKGAMRAMRAQTGAVTIVQVRGGDGPPALLWR